MVNEQMQKHIKRELIESFKVFYSSLYQHKNVEEVEKGYAPHVEDIKELMTLGDDADLRVKFVCITADGTIKHLPYQPIQLFVKDGVDIGEDVERFEVVIKAEYRKRNIKFESSDRTPFFKSETFVVKENSKSVISKLYEDRVEEGKAKAVVVSKADLQEFSNNRIRFGETNTLEI